MISVPALCVQPRANRAPGGGYDLFRTVTSVQLRETAPAALVLEVVLQ